MKIGLAGLVFIVFLVLKLTYIIDWSWWWIAAPLWVPIVLEILIKTIVIVILEISGKK